MKNSHTNYSCLCATEYQTSDPLNTFVCIKCKNTFHISCYDNPTIQILNNSITCIRCRLEIAEPYLSLKYPYLVSPIVLQKEKPVDLSFKLNLTNEDKNHILLGSKKVAIFCTKLKSPVLNNFMYEWPNDKFEISFQGNPISYNIYSYAFLKEIDNYPLELKLVCKEPLSSISVLGVALADKVEIKEIAKEIAKKNRLSSEDAKKKYEDMRQNEMDFSAGIPIKDPMTSFIIYMPVRGFNCEHIDCFDLMSFLSFNRSNFTSMRWKCPICKIVLNSNEIVIDLYLHKIIKEIRSVYLKDNDEKLNLDKFSHIFFDENGEWKYKENFSNVWSNFLNIFYI